MNWNVKFIRLKEMKIRPSYYLVPAVILIIGSLAFTKGTGGKSKIGHLHTNALWEMMPDKKKADTAIAIKQNELATYFEQKRKEFADKWQLYTKDSASLTGAIKEQRVKEILDLQKNLDEMPKSFEKDLLQLKETLYQPIRTKMQAAVDRVSDAQQYDYIFDSSYGTIIFSRNEGDNIMGLVKSELKIK